jgi:hypothetical protein
MIDALRDQFDLLRIIRIIPGRRHQKLLHQDVIHLAGIHALKCQVQAAGNPSGGFHVQLAAFGKEVRQELRRIRIHAIPSRDMPPADHDHVLQQIAMECLAELEDKKDLCLSWPADCSLPDLGVSLHNLQELFLRLGLPRRSHCPPLAPESLRSANSGFPSRVPDLLSEEAESLWSAETLFIYSEIPGDSERAKGEAGAPNLHSANGLRGLETR